MTDLKKATMSTSIFFKLYKLISTSHTYDLQLSEPFYTVPTAPEKGSLIKAPQPLVLSSTSSRASLQAAAAVLQLISPTAPPELYNRFMKMYQQSTLPSVTEKFTHFSSAVRFQGTLLN